MNIAVYGAASPEIEEIYVKEVEELGENLAKRGHNLVFGAGQNGLMGAAARGFKKGGGKVYGVIPEFFKNEDIEDICTICDEYYFTKNMAERKAKMEELADGFVIAPGGIGTFEEFFQVLTLKQLGQHKKPIALFNINGYYYGILSLLHTGVEEEFLRENCLSLFKTFEENEDEQIIAYLEAGPDVGDVKVRDLKYG